MRRIMDPLSNKKYDRNEFSQCVEHFSFTKAIFKIVSPEGKFLDEDKLREFEKFEVLLQDATCVLYPELEKKDEKKVAKRGIYRVFSGLRFFTYVLLDATRLESNIRKTTFEGFVNSVIYVGKGCGERPLSHMKDAKSTQNNRKQHYLAGLNVEGMGVIVADGGDRYSYCHEAFVREDCMMQLYPKTFLLNGVSGHTSKFDEYAEWASEYQQVLVGDAIQIDESTKYEFGIYCLWRKYQAFLVEKNPIIRFENCECKYKKRSK
ncbi:hypothetical protein QR680_017869 [Steinernema hermaphroditum]|uniref:Uncharacterized protein n=1 Tax=Steinernema hermaphroditum TaxID=289476 RepID=A0AA39HG47_9BILA|nr:hypothetical protein QR680_017869 [Steinernema hermaphroditum]